jgi:hypothetical protein
MVILQGIKPTHRIGALKYNDKINCGVWCCNIGYANKCNGFVDDILSKDYANGTLLNQYRPCHPELDDICWKHWHYCSTSFVKHSADKWSEQLHANWRLKKSVSSKLHVWIWIIQIGPSIAALTLNKSVSSKLHVWIWIQNQNQNQMITFI